MRISDWSSDVCSSDLSVEVPAAETTPAVPATVERAPDPKLALDPDRDPNGQQRKADFLAEKREADDINPHTLVAPVSPWTLSAGSVIAASLITGDRKSTRLLQSLMRISYAVFCLPKKNQHTNL